MLPHALLVAALALGPWLVVSDVHYNPLGSTTAAATAGSDTNPALLERSLDAMHRIDPDPPVVLVMGDLLAHHLTSALAASTMAELARRFDRAFPRAQFVLVLGNNDSACGDYRSAPNGAFLRAVAGAWAPLVDRNGAAPAFARDFARRGAYVARLPIRGLRAVVTDDVVWSWRYRACESSLADPVSDQYAWLAKTLRSTPRGDRNWLLLHIPPGVDVFSTRLIHGVVIVPFLGAGQRPLLGLIDDPADRVALVVAGHTHRFAFRSSAAADPARDVAMLLAPAISPIYGNDPAFLTIRVRADGTIADLRAAALVRGRSATVFDSQASFGMQSVNAETIRKVTQRLERDPALQARFARAYDGAARPPEVTPQNFRAFWCATANLDAGSYRRCAGTSIGGGRYPRILAGIAAVLLAIGAALYARRVSAR
jgi:sphingomyelin phosphodiesterase acid-like 3